MYVVARIGKPHGLRGEVTVHVLTDDPSGRFVVGKEFPTEPAEAGPLRLRGVRVHQGIHLLSFDGHADRNAAEALRGTRLLASESVPSGDARTDGADDGDEEAWYPEELIGFAVVDPSGTRLGTVRALHLREAQDLLEVTRPGGGSALVPFVVEIVPEVDVDRRQVVLDAPPGLLDLQE